MCFSVLMSVYIKEKPSYLEDCLASLEAQTLLAPEVVLVEDGAITAELGEVIERYSSRLPLKVIKLEKNMGLATALNEGLKYCTYDLVARMDTDDVALPCRFERQVDFMKSHPEIAVSSAWIEERDQSMQKIIFIKKLPVAQKEILILSKRRNSINHPASIFVKSAVLAVGGYPAIFPEDYALWSLMMVKGYQFANIPEVLLHMRTGNDFIERRGFDFFKGEISLLKYQKRLGFLNVHEYVTNIFLRAAVRLPPRGIRKFLYKVAR